jgi:hypothetical protein
MAIEVFKIINKQTPVYLHDLVTIKKSAYSFYKIKQTHKQSHAENICIAKRKQKF